MALDKIVALAAGNSKKMPMDMDSMRQHMMDDHDGNVPDNDNDEDDMQAHHNNLHGGSTKKMANGHTHS